MNKLKLFCFLTLLFTFSHLVGQEKVNSIKGVVIDSLTREPIPFLAVFIPNTTISTLTNDRGEFSLEKLPLSTTQLTFSHLNYGLKQVWISDALRKGTRITVPMTRKMIALKEVEVIAKRNRRAEADRKYFLRVFYKTFLGDASNMECKLTNPEVLRFRKEGSGIIASSQYPLQIVNNRLGYKLTYYLDYFIFNDSNDYNLTSTNKTFFSFQGVSQYEELKARDSASYRQWVQNRNKEFSGSLGDFLSCVYNQQLSDHGYTVLKAGISDSLLRERVTIAQTAKKAKKATLNIDSVFFFDSGRNQSRYLHYLPARNYPIIDKTSLLGNAYGKTMQFNDTLLVFKNMSDSLSRYDDVVSLFYIGKGALEFYPNGDYQIFNGNLYWSLLDAKQKIINILPLDYQPSHNN